MRKTYIIKSATDTVPVFGFGNDKVKRDREYRALVKRDGPGVWVKQDVRTELDRWMDRMADRVVPYARVDGVDVTTNGIEEDALGLLPLISGWGREGYYLAPRVRKQKLAGYLKTIDWQRVTRVKGEFDIRMSGGNAMAITDRNVYFITEARYKRLMRHCMLSVPVAKFEAELQRAITLCADRVKVNVSGSLDGRVSKPLRATLH